MSGLPEREAHPRGWLKARTVPSMPERSQTLEAVASR